MTVDEMILDLQTRLSDPDDQLISPTIKLEALNDAQSRAINMLSRGSLGELSKINTVAAANPYAISSLSDAYGSGDSITMIKYAASDVYFTPVTLKRIKGLQPTLLAPTATAPYYYIWNSKLYMLQGAGAVAYHIFYISAPTSLASGVSCTLAPSLHEIIVTLAEGICWGIGDKPISAEVAFEAAYNSIDEINEGV